MSPGESWKLVLISQTVQTECCASVVAVIKQATFNFNLLLSRSLKLPPPPQGSAVRNDSAAFPLSSNFLSPFVTTISNPLK